MGRSRATIMGLKMKNRRYRKTEEMILEVFFKKREGDVTMVKIAKEVGICRATMYMHHRAIRAILSDYEKYIIAEYRLVVKRRLRLKDNLPRTLYFDMLTFILKYKKIFKMFLKFDDREILMQMLSVLRLKTSALMRLPNGSEKIAKVYESEIAEIIFEWGKKGFLEKELGKVLSDIMYLTRTAKDRLMPIK